MYINGQHGLGDADTMVLPNRGTLTRVSDVTIAPFSGICRIRTRNSGNGNYSDGTGFLVTPYHVLTCAHVLQPCEAPESSSVTVYPASPHTKDSGVAANGWAISRQWRLNDCMTAGDDIGIIRLSRPVNAVPTSLTAFDLAHLAQAVLTIAGFPPASDERSKQVLYSGIGRALDEVNITACSRSKTCGTFDPAKETQTERITFQLSALSASTKLFRHTLPAVASMSGAPISMRTDNGFAIVGIHNRRIDVDRDPQIYGGAIMITDAVRQQVRVWTQRDLPPIPSSRPPTIQPRTLRGAPMHNYRRGYADYPFGEAPPNYQLTPPQLSRPQRSYPNIMPGRLTLDPQYTQPWLVPGAPPPPPPTIATWPPNLWRPGVPRVPLGPLPPNLMPSQPSPFATLTNFAHGATRLTPDQVVELHRIVRILLGATEASSAVRIVCYRASQETDPRLASVRMSSIKNFLDRIVSAANGQRGFATRYFLTDCGIAPNGIARVELYVAVSRWPVVPDSPCSVVNDIPIPSFYAPTPTQPAGPTIRQRLHVEIGTRIDSLTGSLGLPQGVREVVRNGVINLIESGAKEAFDRALSQPGISAEAREAIITTTGALLQVPLR